jgi:hypothetical protein
VVVGAGSVVVGVASVTAMNSVVIGKLCAPIANKINKFADYKTISRMRVAN